MIIKNSFVGQFGIPAKRLKTFYSRFGWVIALTVILLFAIGLRLIFYTGVLDSDSLEYAYYAYGASHGDFQFTLVPREIQFRIALYLPLGLLYFLFGVSEISTVTYVFATSLLGVILIYVIGRLQANESAGIIAALIWAAFPLNVFLSTLFGPDEILATFTIASVFFFLWGEKVHGKKAVYCYLVGLILALLGIFVKPSAVIIFIFVALFFVYKAFQRRGKEILTKVRRISPLLRNTFLIIGLLGLVIGFLYFQGQVLLPLFRASTDLADLFIRGTTQEDVKGQWVLNTTLFLVSAPLILVSITGLIARRVPGTGLLLLWAGALFFYYEWGSLNTNPSVYEPFLAVINDRNTLFLFAPLVILAGVFFSHRLNAGQARLLALLSVLIVLPFAWLQKLSNFTGIIQNLISFLVPVAILGTLIIPVTPKKQSGRYTPSVVIGLLVVVLIAFLYPTPPLHISAERWQSQISYRRAIREAAEFFLDHRDYPIIALSGNNATELNFLSGFQLGYSVYGVEQPNARIQRVPDPKSWTGSAYIFLRDEINQIQPVPSDWWKVAEYDPGSGKPVLIYRHLSPEDAAAEVENAWNGVADESTLANLERLLAAGVNAGDARAAATAWIGLNRTSTGRYPLESISPTIMSAYLEGELDLSDNLLAFGQVGGLETYQIDQPLVGQVSGSETLLSIQVPENLDGRAGIYTQALLEPDSVYLYSIVVRSNMGVDLLRIQGGKVLDSHDYSDIYPEWEEQVVIFATPSWEKNTNIRLDLLTVAKPGFVQIRDPRLFKVELERP
jgi:4-amino-4-deoxy-L-arabinose transferase-like glycosyltransferase